MNVKFVFLMAILLCFLTVNGQCKDILDYKNLEGLKTINERITIEINVSADESFNLDEGKIRDVIKKKLRDMKLQINGKSNNSLFLNIDGKTTGGGGSQHTIKLSLLSRIPSPFKTENKIQTILWFTERHESNVMRFDPDKKKIVNVKGSINSRVYGTVDDIE